jgi:hypothetical protein
MDIIDELRDAIAVKLAQLLREDEAGWRNAARWIDKRALEEGVDLAAEFDSPEVFARSLIDGMRFHVNLLERFPTGTAELHRFEVAEELFWHIMPQS